MHVVTLLHREECCTKFKYCGFNVTKYTFFLVALEVQEFIEDANESLKDTINHAHFKKMNNIIKESSFQLGIARQRLEQKLALYCNTTTSVTSKLHFSDLFKI